MQMDLLNPFSKQNTLLPSGSWVILALPFLSSSVLYGEVLTFFNPFNTPQTNEAKLEVQGFVANDPVSIRDFFDDWEGKYSPEDSDNLATEMLRIDVGTTIWNDYYVGYFYQRDFLLKANRGLVDGIHTIKNDIKVNTMQYYDLALEAEGVERHGVVISRVLSVVNTDLHHLQIGIAGYLSYDTDVQSGTAYGNGSINPDKSYSLSADANYRFMNNLLYDGWDVANSYGIGYGLHVGVTYENKTYAFSVHLLANDLFARSQWNNLPYSIVNLKTDNKTNSGEYTEYDPTISGWEIYEDFTQKISPKYHADIQKKLDAGYTLELGYENMNYLSTPYISITKEFSGKSVEVMYEHRFHSIGVQYRDENFNVSLLSNGLLNASAVGISGSYIYHY